MCVVRHFDYPCGHLLGDLTEYCVDFRSLPEADQEERKKEIPHHCPKGPVEIKAVARSGIKEDFRRTVDRATKCLNRSLDLLHLGKVCFGEHNLGNLRFASAGGCQRCYEAREPTLMVTAAKWDRIERLLVIKNGDDQEAPFLEGRDVANHKEQQRIAGYLLGAIGYQTELSVHLLNDPFGFTLPMLLLQLPQVEGKQQDSIETSESVHDSPQSAGD
ncbi:MAG: hypothetical protein Q9198_002374 [Flavoplaca austrocitrina]